MKANDIPARSDFHFSDGETVHQVRTVLFRVDSIQRHHDLLSGIDRNEAQERDFQRYCWMLDIIRKSDNTGRPVLVQS